MAFTAAHPVAVVPLARWGLPLSALVVGSMSPDFEYFIRFEPIGTVGHSLPGIALFCVPVGLVVLWAWHAMLKGALLNLLPSGLQRKLAPLCGPFSFRPARRFAAILFALVLAALTHIGWDAFTHPNRWGVRRFPILEVELCRTPLFPLTGFRILQYGSTLAGMGLLAFWLARWYRRTAMPPAADAAPLPVWSAATRGRIVATLLVAPLIPALVHGYLMTRPIVGMICMPPFLGRTVVVALSAFAIEIALFGLWWRFGRQPRVAEAVARSPADR
jgi:hypothetical protein